MGKHATMATELVNKSSIKFMYPNLMLATGILSVWDDTTVDERLQALNWYLQELSGDQALRFQILALVEYWDSQKIDFMRQLLDRSYPFDEIKANEIDDNGRLHLGGQPLRHFFELTLRAIQFVRVVRQEY
eukprot:c25224_g1_i1.p1 GENE.c25224_g1_i1~~c25224_g1_i1.p1  ORF type:complete len:131 (+),score=23.56 c25224_g1_i1:1-393(+)